MKAEQQALLDRVRRALQTARLVLDDGDGPAAVNRAYYTAFWTAQAALRGVGETPRTHAGVQGRFYVRFVEPGLVPPAAARTLAYAGTLRQGADYDISPVFDPDAVAALIADVAAFLQAVEPLLADGPSDQP